MRHWIVILLILWITYPMISWADVGDECTTAMDCSPGEVCIPDRLQTSQFCTRRCNPQQADSCPENYICYDADGIYLCNTNMVAGGNLGDSCEQGCRAGLICIDDGNDSYCSQTCTGPGSCPQGYRCNMGQTMSLCARTGDIAGLGESCDQKECAENLSCIMGEERSLPYCSYECRELACPDFMRCASDALCRHINPSRGLGDDCVIEAEDASTIGCDGSLFCYQGGIRAWCTQSCNYEQVCPEGSGCITANINSTQVDQQDGVCDTNADTEDRFLINPNPESDPNFESNTEGNYNSMTNESEGDRKPEGGASCQHLHHTPTHFLYLLFVFFIFKNITQLIIKQVER